MGFGNKRCGVIGHYQYAVFALFRQFVKQPRKYAAVYKFNGFYLVFGFAAVTALVRCFNMYIYEVACLEQLARRIGFPLKIGVYIR